MPGKHNVKAKVDSGSRFQKVHVEDREKVKLPYGTWPAALQPFTRWERRHPPLPLGHPSAPSRRPPPRSAVPRVTVRPPSLRPLYGTWPPPRTPYTYHERRHPPLPRAKGEPPVPRRAAPPPQPLRVASLSPPKLRAAYGTWPLLRMPFNPRERRHPPHRDPVPPKAPPERPVVHLDLLKHKKQFPKIKNSSQLDNLF